MKHYQMILTLGLTCAPALPAQAQCSGSVPVAPSCGSWWQSSQEAPLPPAWWPVFDAPIAAEGEALPPIPLTFPEQEQPGQPEPQAQPPAGSAADPFAGPLAGPFGQQGLEQGLEPGPGDQGGELDAAPGGEFGAEFSGEFGEEGLGAGGEFGQDPFGSAAGAFGFGGDPFGGGGGAFGSGAFGSGAFGQDPFGSGGFGGAPGSAQPFGFGSVRMRLADRMRVLALGERSAAERSLNQETTFQLNGTDHGSHIRTRQAAMQSLLQLRHQSAQPYYGADD